MKLDLLALDIDGTLLDHKGEITPRTREVLQEIRLQGTSIVLATGRRFSSTLPVVEELQIDTPVITHNGALIFEPNSRNIIYDQAMKMADVLPFISLDMEELDFYLHCADNILFYYQPRHSWGIRYLKRNGPYVENIKEDGFDGRPVHRLVICGRDGQVSSFQEKVFEVKGEIRQIYLKSKVDEGITLLEILHSNASKGTALQHLAGKWQIPPQNVLAVGDETNDMEMIKWAGMGVAMGNAVPELKETADRVCRDNTQEGLALLLDEISG